LYIKIKSGEARGTFDTLLRDCGVCGNDLTHCIIREDNFYEIMMF